MDALETGTDALFILLGASWCWPCMPVLHSGAGHRPQNQVNALVKILVDLGVHHRLLLGLCGSLRHHIRSGADQLAAKNGYELVKFFFLLTFAAAIPAIISGGIAERAKFWPQLMATAVIVVWCIPLKALLEPVTLA